MGKQFFIHWFGSTPAVRHTSELYTRWKQPECLQNIAKVGFAYYTVIVKKVVYQSYQYCLRSSTRAGLVVDVIPDHCVLGTSCDRRVHSENQPSIESSVQELLKQKMYIYKRLEYGYINSTFCYLHHLFFTGQEKLHIVPQGRLVLQHKGLLVRL